MPVDLNKYRQEVESGLNNESTEMDSALERQAFYDYDGRRYERHFRRDAEAFQDWKERSHRASGFLRECVGKLCSHLYCPGPGRKWNEPAGNDFLLGVYRDNLIDSLFHEADKLSTLNSVVAIQIDAGLGDFAIMPITYRLWGREHFAVWTSPEDDRVVDAVCTKDIYDAQIRYRLWSDTECWTFLTRKQPPSVRGGQPTTGGVAATLETREKHDYGVLPFTFIHYELPIKTFETVAVGEFLFRAEICIDNRLMKLDEAIDNNMNPLGCAEGVDENWKPILGPNRFIRMPRANPVMDAGGYSPGEAAKLYYLDRRVDVGGSWEDLKEYILQCLDAVGIPRSAVRMEQMGVASGISLMVEQEPLLKRAEVRRTIYRSYEYDLAYRTLCCAGNHYGKSELVNTAETGELALAWPQPRLAVNTTDKLELGLQEVQSGLKSHLMLIMDWYGVGREEAMEIVRQIQADTTALSELYPEMASVNALPDPEAEAQAAEEEHQRNLEAIAAKQNGAVK